MIDSVKQITIVTGHYGSGKSEVSINYVTKLRKIVDGKIALR